MDTLQEITLQAGLLAEHNRRLVLEYINELLTQPQIDPEDAARIDAPTGPKPKPRKRSAGRKTGTYEEIRIIRNRSGQGGKSYQWRYLTTWQDGKRVKSESLGRVE